MGRGREARWGLDTGQGRGRRGGADPLVMRCPKPFWLVSHWVPRKSQGEQSSVPSFSQWARVTPESMLFAQDPLVSHRGKSRCWNQGHPREFRGFLFVCFQRGLVPA